MRRAARAAAFAAALGLAGPAGAHSDGPPWEAAGGHGCTECHFSAPAVRDSDAIAIDGLPARAIAGRRYRLVVRLTDPGMAAAGYLIGARRDAAPAGRFTPADGRSQALGALARSHAGGISTTGPGTAEWALVWQAPDAGAGAVHFEVRANAADDDRSPLGDRVHERTWVLPVTAGP